MIYVMGTKRYRAEAVARAAGVGPTKWTWLYMLQQLAGVHEPQVVAMNDAVEMDARTAYELRSMIDDRGGTWWTEFQFENGQVPGGETI